VNGRADRTNAETKESNEVELSTFQHHNIYKCLIFCMNTPVLNITSVIFILLNTPLNFNEYVGTVPCKPKLLLARLCFC